MISNNKNYDSLKFCITFSQEALEDVFVSLTGLTADLAHI